MDTLIILIGLAFMGLLGVFGYQAFNEVRNSGKKPNIPDKKANEPDPAAQYKRKIRDYEEKIKMMELDCDAVRLELSQAKEREKASSDEKSITKFDSEQYEKFKKEHHALKQELALKEAALEKEISLRRAQGAEADQLKQEHAALKKELMETQDYYRKSLAISENLDKELKVAKKTIDDQKKIVVEHTENKLGGEWVSRAEFEKVEKELEEKEAMIQKFLSLKNEKNNPA
ncbi:MAG: hypothetical protein HZB36_05775 [Candidatus Omnitrophica bacterium]|nr:hypothetical protein [Candidatus Omnitrophota bacterium]